MIPTTPALDRPALIPDWSARRRLVSARATGARPRLCETAPSSSFAASVLRHGREWTVVAAAAGCRSALQKRRCSMNREPIPDRFCAQQAGTTPSYRRRLGRFPIAASSAVKSTARTTASCSATNSGNGPDRSASASVTRCPDIGDFCHNRQGVEWWGCALCAARAAPCSHYVLNGECDDAPVCAI
jgi:hypothetical protein